MNIAVVGAGEAGKSLIENLKAQGNSLKVFLIERQSPSFRKSLLLDWLVGRVPDMDFFIDLERIKQDYPFVEVINDKATRINFEKKKLFFKDSQSLDFDKIVLCCGLSHKKISFQGSFKEGVYYLADGSVAKLKDNLIIFNDIIVYADTVLGLSLALRLSSLKDKEIKIISQDLNFIPDSCRSKVLDKLREKNIDVYLSQQISEALGESRTKAIKLSSGKFLACDVLILDTPYINNTDILRDSQQPNQIKGSLLEIDAYMNAGIDFCYACGDIANKNVESRRYFLANQKNARAQGRIVASNILGAKETFSVEENIISDALLENIIGV